MSDNRGQEESTISSKRITLVISAIAAFIGAMNMNAVTVAVPSIAAELKMNAVLMVWIINSVMLVSTISFIAFGRLGDIFGRKKIFLYGFILNVISGFLCGTANSEISFVIYRALQGLAGGMTLGTAVALLTSVFPVNERGKALGINAAALYLGIASGPSLGGILTQHLGWRSLFYLFGGLSVMVVVLVLWKLKGEWADARGEKLDIPGTITVTLSMIFTLVGFTYLPSAFAIILMVLGIAGMFLFVRIERRTRHPVLDLGVFKGNRPFVFSNLATALNYVAMASIAFFASLYLQYIKGLGPQTAGLILLVQPVVITVFAVISGRLSDRIEPQAIASTGMLFTFIAMVLFYFIDETTSLLAFMLCLALVGLSQGLFTTPNITAIMSSVDARYLGAASGTQATTRGCGMVFGLGITTIAFNHFIGNVQMAPQYYPAFMTSMKICFLVASVMAFAGMFSQFAGRNKKN
jgi:MFS family permease